MYFLIAAALLPAVLLLLYIYRKDCVEREPPRLLAKLLLFGVLSAVPAILLERLLGSMIDLLFGRGLLYTAVSNFIGVALVEEGCKLFFLKRGSWRHPAFDYRFDGIVYAVFVSLGFAGIENVLYVLYSHRGELLKGLVSSLELMLWGVTIALASSVVFGILVGWFTRPREAIMPIVRVISPIPALAYTTYVVGCMPSFKSSSIVVIFLSVFWPLFSQVIRTVGTMDKRIIESARVMNVGSITMIKDIVYPYVLPTVLRYLPSSLSTAFMCLTGAEMIGASSGLGFFIRKYAEYANYTNVLAGIIFMGLVVTMLSSLVKLVQKKFIKW